MILVLAALDAMKIEEVSAINSLLIYPKLSLQDLILNILQEILWL